ncbi:MAG TPA: 50S ribosomal protein L17, partial [Bacteroidales bacterium]|nr:50S ribosomal protein L17 [Bacteroidales bacterium]
MRHGKKFNHLGRKSQHRKATLMNLANSLIIHKRIKTTVAKAKALRVFVEPLITKSKDDSTHSRRVVFSYLKDKEVVTTLFRDVSAKVADRQGGYTRIIKLGTRYGDNAEMCYIELVDYNENLLSAAKTKKKTTRRRRSKKTASSTVAATSPTSDTKENETSGAKNESDVKNQVEEKTENKKVEKVEEKKEKVENKKEEKKEEKKTK